MTPTSLVAYLALFAGAGFLFLLASLLLGRLLRARAATPEKLETYECGEPAVGSSFVQFDLRFYVVALVFIIFEVEVAFFFPWATVFGKAAQMTSLAAAERSLPPDTVAQMDKALRNKYSELGVHNQSQALSGNPTEKLQETVSDARALGLAAIIDMGLFFVVLLVGFAYVWSQGDLDWVRAPGRRQPATSQGIADVSLARSVG